MVISTREGAYKTRNLRRDPTVVLCVLSDDIFGRWIQVEGTAQIVSLPEAMEGLVDYYRCISGEHPDWDDYRRAMQHDQRVRWFAPHRRGGPGPRPLASSAPVVVGSPGGGRRRMR